MFDRVKQGCGITRDINYYCTEFNGSEVGGEKEVVSNEDKNAKVLLTMLWGQLTVTGAGGPAVANLKTLVAMPYSISGNVSKVGWGLAAQIDPWKPSVRGQTLQWASQLAAGLRFSHVEKGSYVLQGGGRKLWVLQNRTGYTDHDAPVPSIEVGEFPAGATDLEVWYADGLNKTIPINAASSVSIDGLRPEETVMILARPKFTGIVSRKTHGPAGDLDVAIDTSGQGGVTTEPRSNRDGLTLVFNFAEPIASASLELTAGLAKLSGPLVCSGNSVIAHFEPPADKQTLQLRLAGIKTKAGDAVPDVTASVALLLGDVDGNHAVDERDERLVTYQESKSVLGAQRARCDVDLSGLVDDSDLSAIKASEGNTVP
jgi:hypothetical protein